MGKCESLFCDVKIEGTILWYNPPPKKKKKLRLYTWTTFFLLYSLAFTLLEVETFFLLSCEDPIHQLCSPQIPHLQLKRTTAATGSRVKTERMRQSGIWKTILPIWHCERRRRRRSYSYQSLCWNKVQTHWVQTGRACWPRNKCSAKCFIKVVNNVSTARWRTGDQHIKQNKQVAPHLQFHNSPSLECKAYLRSSSGWSCFNEQFLIAPLAPLWLANH